MSDPASGVLHVFASFEHGGVPIRIANVLNRIGHGFHHTIVALDGKTDSRSRIDPELSVTFETPGFTSSGLLSRFRGIARFIHDTGPDLMITYNWGAIEWAMANRIVARVPHIHMESGFGSEEADRQIFRRVQFRRLALARSRALVVPSRVLMELARDIWRIPAERIAYIPNGVDCDRFNVSARPGRFSGFEKRDGDIVVGTVAPLRREKNLSRLIRAFAALQADDRVRLLIVGDGAERGKLEELAGARNIADRTWFAGHVETVEDVLGLIDVFAITSDTEQMPNALLQAMAAGRAIAGVSAGDVRDMVAEANRPFIVPRDDEAELVSALRRLISDAALRDELGRANRSRAVSEYSFERMLARYEEAVFAPYRRPDAASRTAETTA